MHLSPAEWGDEHVSQVSILGMVPLLLQFGLEQADVWTLSLSVLLTDTLALLSKSTWRKQTTRSPCSSIRLGKA